MAAEGREGGGGTSCKYVAKELFTPRKCQKLTVNMQQLLTVYFNFLSSLLKLLAHSFSALSGHSGLMVIVSIIEVNIKQYLDLFVPSQPHIYICG